MLNKGKWQRCAGDVVHELLHGLPRTRLVAREESWVGEQGASGHEAS